MNLEQYVNLELFRQQARLADAFAAGQPFRHVVIDHFFQPEFCQQLLDNFPSFKEELAVTEDGNIGNKAVHEHISKLAAPYPELDRVVQSQQFLDLVSAITGISGLKYDPYYFGGGTHENRHGQELDPHIDFNYHPKTDQHRRLNLIVYLNHDWQQEWGGALSLHTDPYLPPRLDRSKAVIPLFNRCVVFETSEYSWHSFDRIALPADKRHLSRKSFALYLYTDERPKAETGPHHSTVYVNRHLPAHIRGGKVLSEEDYQTVERLVAIRDQHLKRLYGYIASLSEEAHEANKYVDCLKREAAKADQIIPPSRVAYLEKTLADIRESSSWRITAPLRWAGYRVRQILGKNHPDSGYQLRPCPISGDKRDGLRLIGRLPVTHGGNFSRDSFDLVYSTEADTVYLSPLPTESDLAELYQHSTQFESHEYEGERRIASMLEYYSSCAERHFGLPDRENFELLEVGAGLAWVSRAVKGLNRDAKTQAQDISNECADRCEWVDNYFIGRVSTFIKTCNRRFDAISLSHVIEHVPDPVRMVRQLRALLKADGVMLLTAPYRPIGWRPDHGLDPWLSYSYTHVPAHITYLSEAALKLLARKTGMRLRFWDGSGEDGQAFEAVLSLA